MKLRCLSKGGGFHFPPCHMMNICGFRILLECPVDLSALTIFSPIPTHSHPNPTAENSDQDEKSSNLASGSGKKRKIEKTLEAADLISAEPCYKTVGNLHLWDLSSIDIVLISSAMGILGLPFLTRNSKFSAMIYATEATRRLGQLMMEDLVSMHAEFVKFYGPEDSCFPQWMKLEELDMLPLSLRETVMGEDGMELWNWQALYSAGDVKDCIQKVHPLNYAEEACYNGTLIIKAFSSGLEIGASNWTIRGPRRNLTYLSSSIFESAHAMDFDYHTLQGSDLILFSDFSSLHKTISVSKNADGTAKLIKSAVKCSTSSSCSVLRDTANNGEEVVKSLVSTDESSEELDKLTFICSCAVNSVKGGGSVLIPIGRLGTILQLLEQISLSLESSNLKVPIFIISSVAEETLAFTNIVPEWLCKKRQERLFSGDALFRHSELINGKKLHLFSFVHSPDLLTMWQEPCIVFSPHWSLRLGPVVHLLQRWCGDHNCLLVLEQGVDVDLALLPFKPMAMKVLQCQLLSGIKIQKVQPLLEMLQPKLVLLPEDWRLQHLATNINSSSFLYYSENETLRVPSLMDDFEAGLGTDLAFQLQPRRMQQENMALARLKGELRLSLGKHFLVSSKEPIDYSHTQLLYWGTVDPNRLITDLNKKGIKAFVDKDGSVAENACLIHIDGTKRAIIEISSTRTVISTADETLAADIFETVSGVLDGI
ncbi:integrator complex subunit [Tasmannia lanceolata]|uniref:integrator complex subunit n=1 Tax=Tasmannia lanceolata TaxID=3420 RepID=UPI00406349FE